MLKTVDVLIGFSLVMLILSMAVTVVTQLVSSTLNTRGKSLKNGIQDLLQLLDRGLTPKDAAGIADTVLRDPKIGEPPWPFSKRRGLATAVHREELTKLLLSFAAASPVPAPAGGLQTKLRESLMLNGIADPEAVLKAVRGTMLDLEKNFPEMADYQRQARALLEHATSDFLGKINAWFDQTIDRVSANFTFKARLISGIVALILAGVLQVDALAIINRLSVDDALRNELVKTALANPEKFAPPASPTVSEVKTTPVPPKESAQPAPAFAPAPDQDLKKVLEGNKSNLQMLANLGILQVPKTVKEWKDKFVGALPGMILSVLLLSLGAPFWYRMLKDLIRLRSLISSKDDAQRLERQTEQPKRP